MDSDQQHCLDSLRHTDYYAQLLYIKDTLRGPAASIYAFAHAIDQIPALVSEPMPGEVRLQWWRDVFSGDREGEALSNPIAKALLQTISDHELSAEGFNRYLDAKTFDLYNDPMPDVETLEAYFGETDSFLLQSVVAIHGAEMDTNLADACGHSGVAIGVARILLNTPSHCNMQRCYIPRTMLEENDLSTTIWFAADLLDGHKNAHKAFAEFGLKHVVLAKSAIKKCDKNYANSFLSLSLAENIMKRAVKLEGDPRTQMVHQSPLAKQWILLKTAFTGI